MRVQSLTFASVPALALLLLPGIIEAQALKPDSKAAAPSAWKLPRTADGQPDLQGVWANNNATPLERPKELEGRPTLTDAEVAALKKKATELFSGNGDAAFGDDYYRLVWASVKAAESGPHKKAANEFDGGTGDYSSIWIVQRDWDNRTSLITDPPDGKIPPMTPEGKKQSEATMAALLRPPAGPQDRGLSERCISYGSPQLIAGYQSYYQIFQTKDSVVILTEMIHDARVIPLNGGPHVPSNIRGWNGDSRGHWEGDTLVVDTTNYKPRSFMNSGDKLHVIERFSRSGPETLKYEITIDDPETWTKPWSLMIPLRQTQDRVFEYACHEGNSGMIGILAGARAEERAAASQPKPESK
jgi:hypothetical protein